MRTSHGVPPSVGLARPRPAPASGVSGLALLAWIAFAAATPCAAEGSWNAVRLADGRPVLLVGLAPPSDAGLARRAAALAGGLAGAPGARTEDGRRDRYGRLLADVRAADGRSVRTHLLSAGLALADVARVPEDEAAGLLVAEAEARAAERGVWAGKGVVRPAETLPPDTVGFRLVEGRIVAVAEARGAVYLNFGPDRRTDFTLRLDSEDRGRFRRSGPDVRRLAGRTVRVRGWVYAANGPMIDLVSPSQIEVMP